MWIRGLISMLVALCASDAAHAQRCDEAGSGRRPADAIAQGGRLYDNWWVTCGLPPPRDRHPAYPAGGRQSGAVTWRCKECHGWDYRGKDGAYGKGSHFTGIAGITGSVGRSEAAVVAILKNPTHRFDTVMADATLERIARFVSRGQVDAGARIDAATKKVAARVEAGRYTFERRCTACHGAKGRAINFSGKASDPEFVGTIAADNPWEMLHKIRNGQPGAVMDEHRLSAAAADPDGSVAMPGRAHMRRHMLAGRAMPPMREQLSFEQQLDLLSYLQTLPAR